MSQSLAKPSRRDFLRSIVSPPAPQRFTRVAPIGEATTGVLWAAHAIDRTNLFVAGDDGLIFRWDGKVWEREPIGTDLPIHAMTDVGENTIIAVGWLGLICERQQGKWAYVQGGQNTRGSTDPDEIRRNLPLFDVANAPNGDAWAVGDGGRVVRRSEGLWTEVDCPTNMNLRSVLVLNNGSVLVGGAGGTVLRCDDDEWSTIESGTDSQVLSLAARADNDILAVGGQYDGSTAGFVGRLFTCDGFSWTQVSLDQKLPRLRRIRREKAESFLIVGDGGAAFRYEDDQLKRLETRLRHDLHDAVGIPDDTPLLCGDGGVVLVASAKPEAVGGPAEESLSRPTPAWSVLSEAVSTRILRGLWAASDDQMYAVGDAGTALCFQNGSWSDLEIPGEVRLHSVWGTSSTNVYACGDESKIFHFDGEQWTLAYDGGLDVALLAITGFGTHDIFVVGDNGTALRYDGVHWHSTETGTRHELYDVWGLDGDHVLAVGGGGVVARWNGEEWATFNAGVDEDLFAVWGDRLDRIYAAGLSGRVVRFDGHHFEKEFTGIRNDLQAICGCRDGQVFAVGSRGVAPRFDGESWATEECGTDATLRAIALTERHVFAVGTGGLLLRREIG